MYIVQMDLFLNTSSGHKIILGNGVLIGRETNAKSTSTDVLQSHKYFCQPAFDSVRSDTCSFGKLG